MWGYISLWFCSVFHWWLVMMAFLFYLGILIFLSEKFTYALPSSAHTFLTWLTFLILFILHLNVCFSIMPSRPSITPPTHFVHAQFIPSPSSLNNYDLHIYKRVYFISPWAPGQQSLTLFCFHSAGHMMSTYEGIESFKLLLLYCDIIIEYVIKPFLMQNLNR